MQDAIVRDPAPDILKLRNEGEDIPRGHRRHIGDPEHGLLRAEVVSRLSRKHLPHIVRSPTGNEQHKKTDQPKPIHDHSLSYEQAECG